MMQKKKYCQNKKHKRGIGGLFGTAGVLFGLGMGGGALSLKQKNDRYRDALIDLSDQFPKEVSATQRRQEWESANAPANRKTVEERLADQRTQEE